MFRRWLSAFWRDNKEKIIEIAKVFGILIAVSTCATLIFSNNNRNVNENSIISKEIYKPRDAIISNGEISEKVFEQESLEIEAFVDYCNEKNYSEAYNLLSEECKEKIYPTLEDFIENYCEKIFQQNREFHLQAWAKDNYANTYKIRYTDDFMATGQYEDTIKYEDYITVITNEENMENKKLNINNYIGTEEINKEVKKDIIDVQILNVDIYINYITYNLNIKNISNERILLDNLNSNTIKLIGSNGASYKLDSTNLNTLNLLLDINEQKNIKITFNKQYGSGIVGNKIEFRKVIPNYFEYLKSNETYNNYKEIIINL